ncbi:recombinase family protein [Pseudomonas kairouanensis]|uniref:Recombinase family protein n=1 Tax=Pseudomonas kairouanensis TaxID=2293832 RepID=A0A4Z0ATA1_9PSED|nr:recombinase family protein [Pseudomonas kairouanensis]TFY89620.1 recombinase family protein [Pseudomonas kairouanensis]
MSNRPKAYSYVRFSTPEQAKGDSRRRQYKAAIEYADKHNLELVKDSNYAFLDAGVSAYRGSNVNRVSSSLGRFYDYVKEGVIAPGSYLLVESLDRLSREQVTEALPRFLDLLNSGIIVVTFGDGTVYKKSAETMQLVMSIFHMSRAHSESSIKGQRVSDAWRQKQAMARAEGVPLGAACPQWLAFDGEAYKVIPDRASVVKRVFDLTIQGYGQRAIVKLFNSEGVPVFGSENRNKSGLWGNSSIGKILVNRSVLGEYQPNIWTDGQRRTSGEPIKGFYPPVIDEELYYAALDSRKSRNVSKAAKTSSNFNVWAKIAVCAYCKSPMHLVNKGKPPKGRKYIRCSKSAKGACINRSVRLDESEIVFQEMLAKLNMASLIKDNAQVLRKRISELDGRIESARLKLVDVSALLQSYPSRTLAETAASVEGDISKMVFELDKCKADLSSEYITDKFEFFKKLDLISYEGRYLANQQVQRLGIAVRIKHDDIRTQYTVMVGELPKFIYMADHGQDPLFVPFSIEILRAGIRQNDMQATKFITKPDRMLKEALSDESMATYKSNVQGDIDVHKFRFSAADNEAANQKLLKIFEKQFWGGDKGDT